MRERRLGEVYLRNFVFGVEDSLVSTVGLLSGIAAAGVAQKDILVSGVVLIFVEAFSMAVGSFLSEEFAEEYVAKSRVSDLMPFLGGAVRVRPETKRAHAVLSRTARSAAPAGRYGDPRYAHDRRSRLHST